MTALKAELGAEATEFLAIKKLGTRHVYRAGLRWFLTYYRSQHGDVSLSDFLDRLDENAQRPRRERRRLAEIEVNGFIDYLSEKGKSNKTIRAYFAAIQNFLKYKTFTVNGNFIRLPRDLTKKGNRKHPWTLDQIRALVAVATNPRDQAIILCLFQSGIAVGDLCALNYGDIQTRFEQGELPLFIEYVRKKTGEEVKTCLGRDAVKYLRRYLDIRSHLQAKDPLFVMQGKQWGQRITEKAILHRFHEYSQHLPFLGDEARGGFSAARPHSLRAAFRSRLTGKMDRDLLEFMMGHALGDIKKQYLEMHPDEIREVYANYEGFLAIEKTSKDEATVMAADVNERQLAMAAEIEVLKRRMDAWATVFTRQQELIQRLMAERRKES